MEQLRHSAPPAATGGSVQRPRLTRRRARPARAAPEAEAVPHQAPGSHCPLDRSIAGRVTGSALSFIRPEPQRPNGPGRPGGPVTAVAAAGLGSGSHRTQGLSPAARRGQGPGGAGVTSPAGSSVSRTCAPAATDARCEAGGRVYRRCLTALRVSQPRGCGRGPFPVQGTYLRFTGKFNLSLELDPLYGFNIRSFTAQCCKRQQPGL